MPYAITKTNSWRAINSAEDLTSGESFSDNAPVGMLETTITPSQQIIMADGVDVAKVIINGEPGAMIDYMVNGDAHSLELGASGIEMLYLTCDTPNTTLLVQVGTTKAVIYAVEVPS